MLFILILYLIMQVVYIKCLFIFQVLHPPRVFMINLTHIISKLYILTQIKTVVKHVVVNIPVITRVEGLFLILEHIQHQLVILALQHFLMELQHHIHQLIMLWLFIVIIHQVVKFKLDR
jgi:hypothetical protein